MRRREVFIRALRGALGAVAAVVAPAGARNHGNRQFPPEYDASKELARPDWKPAFLDTHQNETLVVLSDHIIPATETPGAKEALVNRFIDRLLAAETIERRREFLESLAYVDGECLARYRAAFIHLPQESQLEFLRFLAYPHNLVTWGDNRSEFAGPRHFRNLKDWISRAYYSSETGMKELGWKGNPYHDDFEGCGHPPGSHK